MRIPGGHSPHKIFKKLCHPGSSPPCNKRDSFNLHIFTEKMKATHASQTSTVSNEQPFPSMIIYYNDIPLKAISLPRWSSKWFSDLNVMPLDKEMKHMEYQQRQYSVLSEKKKDELCEYTYAVHACITNVLIIYGIKDSMDYYQKIMLDNELSEEIHQAVSNCLADNDRIMELMKSFGLSLF
ncbi:MAG: hypothetical protein JW927_15350 [Deltaproteobacteria bacterium]|nr:hypothetical protein [Deltaproteobacteria bacterium]